MASVIITPDAMIEPLRTIPLSGAKFEVWSADHVRTVFDDGAEVPASPDGTAAQTTTSRRLGYGADVARMVRHHELAHSLVAEWCGLPCSPTLRRVAHGEPCADEEAEAWEEALVLAFQRFVSTGVVAGPLRFFTRDLAGWRACFMDIVGGDDLGVTTWTSER